MSLNGAIQSGPGSASRNRALLVLSIVLATTMTGLPVWLASSLSIFIREEMALDPRLLGFAISGFFVVSALTTLPAGRAAERLGARTTLLLALLVSMTTMLTISFAPAWVWVAGALLFGGIANGLIHPAVGLAISQQVDVRRGLAFGLKQAAIPTATLLAGLAVPTAALLFGWRTVYRLAALAALLIAVLAYRTVQNRRATHGSVRGEFTTPFRILVILSIAAGFGASGAGATAAFLVPSAVEGGMPPTTAGLIAVAASIASITARVSVGWRADYRIGGHFRVIATLMALGALGPFVLSAAQGRTAWVAAGAILTFTAGWGWPGLMNFAVVERNRLSPAAATSVVVVGAHSGSVVGPSLFGVLVVAFGYQRAWMLVALLPAIASAMVWYARSQMHAIEKLESSGPLDA